MARDGGYRVGRRTSRTHPRGATRARRRDQRLGGSRCLGRRRTANGSARLPVAPPSLRRLAADALLSRARAVRQIPARIRAAVDQVRNARGPRIGRATGCSLLAPTGATTPRGCRPSARRRRSGRRAPPRRHDQRRRALSDRRRVAHLPRAARRAGGHHRHRRSGRDTSHGDRARAWEPARRDPRRDTDDRRSCAASWNVSRKSCAPASGRDRTFGGQCGCSRDRRARRLRLVHAPPTLSPYRRDQPARSRRSR